MKTIAVKFLSVLSLVAVIGTVAMTAACPDSSATEGEGE